MTELVAYDDVVARYDPVLGLEVHVELGTETKLVVETKTRMLHFCRLSYYRGR